MKFYKLSCILLLSLFSTTLLAQDCADCGVEAADFCFKDSSYVNKCASFFDDKPYFLYKKKKKPIEVAIDSVFLTKNYYMKIASNKKLKLDAVDMLFLQEALSTWSGVKMTIGYEMNESGLGIKWVKKGSGDLPVKGRNVTVHYTGYLLDGSKFDSSVDRGTPFSFQIGVGKVIKGWDLAIMQMPIGSKAFVLIPPVLGYGSRNLGVIPPESTLIFEVEVIAAD